MDARNQTPRERLARRIGMALVAALIVWTIAAVATSVISQLGDTYRAAPAAEAH